MRAEGVRRLLVTSMMGIGTSRTQAPFWYKFLLMPTFLHGSTQDKTLMESAVSGSGLDYVIARPPILKDGPATGSVTVLGDGDTGHSIPRPGTDHRQSVAGQRGGFPSGVMFQWLSRSYYHAAAGSPYIVLNAARRGRWEVGPAL